MKRAIYLILNAVMALSVSMSGTALAIPFANGSFESGPGANEEISVGEFLTGTDGWVGVSNSGWYWVSGVGPASAGTRHMGLNANNTTGGIEQTFDTVPLTSYRVIFDYAAISNGSALSYDFSHEIVGVTTALPITATTSGSNFNTDYTLDESFTFVATGSSSTLRFLSLTAGSSAYGPVIDNVRIEELQVPEPSTILLLALGILGLVRHARRRRGRA